MSNLIASAMHDIKRAVAEVRVLAAVAGGLTRHSRHTNQLLTQST